MNLITVLDAIESLLTLSFIPSDKIIAMVFGSSEEQSEELELPE